MRRTGIEDIKSLAAMIIQSEKFGTSLAQALKVYADALRTRRRLRAEAAVGKAGIKMLFPIVLFILPVLFVITLVPGMLSVLKDLKLLGAGKVGVHAQETRPQILSIYFLSGADALVRAQPPGRALAPPA